MTNKKRDHDKAQMSPEDYQRLRELRAQKPARRAPKFARTQGAVVADWFAKTVGSWRFIIIQSIVLAVWIVLNFIAYFSHWDPYPFILLNLVLSTLAAIQAPLIIMSQRRQEIRDRLRAENDYRVNLKAELEIRQLHEKVDHILLIQWKRMLEIQEIQIELLNELKK